MLGRSAARMLRVPSASTTARSTRARTAPAISLSATDTPMDSDPPKVPKAAATETAITEL